MRQRFFIRPTLAAMALIFPLSISFALPAYASDIAGTVATQNSLNPLPTIGQGALQNVAGNNTWSGTVTLTPADLGVTSVGTLPTSHFYFLKQWGRGIQRFFTFNPVAKAELELKFTNETAAELIEVEKVDSTGAATLNALQNFTDEQDRLNLRLEVVGSNLKNLSVNGNLQIADLTKNVEEKTGKHVQLLQQIGWISTESGQQSINASLDKAQNNTLRTFTITFTATNDAPSLMHKATDKIANAEQVIATAEAHVFGQPVTFTATVVNTSNPEPTAGTTIIPAGPHTISATYNGTIVIGFAAVRPAEFLTAPGGETALGGPDTSTRGDVTVPDSVTWTVVGGVNLIARYSGVGVDLKTTTGPDGSFEFTGLKAGTYDLLVGDQVLKSRLLIGTDGGTWRGTVVTFTRTGTCGAFCGAVKTGGGVLQLDNQAGLAAPSGFKKFPLSSIAVINGGDLLLNLTSTDGLAVGNLIRIDNELMLITALTPTSLTVTRGANGTVAGSHKEGATITAVYNGDLNNRAALKFWTAIPSFLPVIINATGDLASAKDLLVTGNPGGAYGLAAYDAAFIGGVRVAVGDVNGDGVLDITVPTPAPTPSPSDTNPSFKIPENESPNPTDRLPIKPAPTPTPGAPLFNAPTLTPGDNGGTKNPTPEPPQTPTPVPAPTEPNPQAPTNDSVGSPSPTPSSTNNPMGPGQDGAL